MIRDAQGAARLREKLHAGGGRLVFTNGCFDLLHAGHVRYLAAARELGDALIVGLNSDASVRSLKGPGRPLNTAADRAEVLGGLRSVDGVVVFGGDRATGLIREIRPHVYAKGGDYTPETLNAEERAALEEVGAAVEILPLVPGKSTSATLSAIGGDRAEKFRIGVLGSGAGSNLESIFRHIESGKLDVEVVLVVSDVKDAPILERGRRRGVEAVFVDPGENPKRLPLPAQKEIADRLRAAGADLVVCAGFMRVLKAPLFDAFGGRIINTHPSLLPRHKGLKAWEQALKAGDEETGCTVHFVNEEVDEGRIIRQARVPILPGDSPEKVLARIQEQEYRLLPAVIGDFAAGVFK